MGGMGGGKGLHVEQVVDVEPHRPAAHRPRTLSLLCPCNASTLHPSDIQSNPIHLTRDKRQFGGEVAQIWGAQGRDWAHYSARWRLVRRLGRRNTEYGRTKQREREGCLTIVGKPITVWRHRGGFREGSASCLPRHLEPIASVRLVLPPPHRSALLSRPPCPKMAGLFWCRRSDELDPQSQSETHQTAVRRRGCTRPSALNVAGFGG